MIPYGAVTLVYGVFSDRIGRRRILLASFAAFVLLTGLTATAQSNAQLLVWRLLTGIGASAVVPLSLALMGSLFPYEHGVARSAGSSAPWPAGWRSVRPSAPSWNR